MIYRVEMLSSALKELAALPASAQRRLDAAIRDLAQDPFPGPPHSVPLHGEHKGKYRRRVGDYRIIYRVERDALVVLIVAVAHRREAYR